MAGGQGVPAANGQAQAPAFALQNPVAVAAAMGQLQALIFGINNPAAAAVGNGQVHVPAFEVNNPGIFPVENGRVHAPARVNEQQIFAAGNVQVEVHMPAQVNNQEADAAAPGAQIRPNQEIEIEPEQQVQTQRGQNDDVQRMCVACLLERATHALIPCGHHCVCVECKDRIAERCPLCRQEVTDSLLIY